MSRIAKNPITLPSGVDVNISGAQVSVKGAKGNLQLLLHDDVKIAQEDGKIQVAPRTDERSQWAILKLVVVGYRALVKGKALILNLGFSHPVDYPIPEGVSIVTPSQTEIVVSGCDKQKVGQVAAEIRAFRPPEPYKGKGVRYENEYVVRKEAKKK